MIKLILDSNNFEQDIRELLMAFYPGETFLYEDVKHEEIHLEVYGNTTPDSYAFQIKNDTICLSRKEEIDFANRFDAKNQLKRMLYQMLNEITGKELPWGTLTGIRPVKIPMAKIIEGDSLEQIQTYLNDTYLASRQKIDLSLEIAVREQQLLAGIDYEAGYSLYIGIPFCPTTCLYCSFTSFPIGRWEKKIDLYLNALFKELEFVSRAMKGRVLNSIYMGGGTPTSISAKHLDLLLSKIETLFDCSSIKEFTVEAGRPDSITEEKLQVLREHHISRISINPQTMKQATLDLIGRRHSVEMVKDTFLLARKLGFDNINMDLITGLPEETLEDVRNTMEEVKKLKPDGITVHSLAIKRAARLHMFREKYENLKIENTQEMIQLTADYANELNMMPYYLYRQKNMAGNFENVGYAMEGKACIYNILIMEELQTIVACGAGTTTKVVFPKENRLERIENVKDADQYMERIDEMIERKRKFL